MPFGDPAAPVPSGLRTDEFVLRPIRATDAERDHDAVMETREDLRTWEQTGWPGEDFTVEANREDLVDLERRHAEHRAFTYTVVDPGDAVCLGCVYVFPTAATFLARSAVTAVADTAWSDVEAVVYFWVRASRVATGLDERLLRALRSWFSDEWAFERTVYVTSELFEQQRRLLETSGLRPCFELVEPGKPGRYLAFA
jgi:hypothetical protein